VLLFAPPGRGHSYEAHVPAPQSPSRPNARFSRPNGDQRRAEGPREPPPQGAQAPRHRDLQEVVLGATFDRSRRLRRKADFRRVQADARRVVTRHFVLLVASRPEAQPVNERPRIGLIVSRKVGGAVARNRVKRLCRECFRLSAEMLPDGVDLIVVARDGAESMKLQEVQDEWRGATVALRRRSSEALAQSRGATHVSGAGPRTRAKTTR
jgi:ribonuclease P protein component